MKRLIFFFASPLPAYSKGDIPRLQCYNTMVDYDETVVESPFVIELVEYMKAHDGMWRGHPLDRAKCSSPV